jgi:hypothetical protein
VVHSVVNKHASRFLNPIQIDSDQKLSIIVLQIIVILYCVVLETSGTEANI